jgi:hypothetical protein
MQGKENNHSLHASLFIAPAAAVRCGLFLAFEEGI